MTKKTKDFQYYADKAEVYITLNNRTQYAEDMALRRAQLYVRLAAVAPHSNTGAVPHEVERLRTERDLYRNLARQLYDDDPCSFDHHGGCQTHMWLEPEPGEECPDRKAQRLFAQEDK